MKEYNYTLGLDPGVGSLGTAIIDTENSDLIEFSTRIFDTAEEAKTPRNYRSSRRNLRRKKWRKEQLKDAFVDFGILTKEEISEKNYLSYTAESSNFKKPTDDTVYHLRVRSLSKKVSKREILLCLYNILQSRGHFLMESIDFEKDPIDFKRFKEMFYDVTSIYIKYFDNKSDFEKLLENIFENYIKSKELKEIFNQIRICDDEDNDRLFEILKIINGFKGNPSKISNDISLDNEKTVNVIDLKKIDDLNDFLSSLVELYDLIKIHKLLKNHNYICEMAVEEIDKLKNTYICDKEKYKELCKTIRGKMVKPKKNPKSWKNIENNFPNGLYLKEVSAILSKQSEYYPEITSEFITACRSIVSAKIPYYIGPLSENAKNSWLVKNGNFKYSYSYSKKNAVNEYESIRKWKERMISHCTYLPNEYAMPKGSFVAETYSILNELNIMSAVDRCDNDYYLTREDKIKLFDCLYLNKEKETTFEEIEQLLGLNYFGTKRKGVLKRTNNQYTLYHKIVKILPSLKVNSILEIFNNKEKIDKLEEIILNLNLFDEELSKKEFFLNPNYGYGYSEEIASKLSKIKSVKFYSVSRKFVMDQPLTKEGETLIDLLFDDNNSSVANEQMTHIYNAKDRDGNPYEFETNKYLRKLKDNDGKLSVDLLFDEDKPIIPISRPVIRSLNECMKMYMAVIDLYGFPQRIVVETTRELHRLTPGEMPEKHFKKMESLYTYLVKQLKENNIRNDVDDWNEIESYLSKNKQKIELYLRQNGKDIITNEPIHLNNLNDYEIDHILYRGFGDDSLDDKILIKKITNDKKGHRVPLQFIESPDGYECCHVTSSDYIKRVKQLHDMKLISDKKLKMLLLESDNEVFGFINQNLVDTSYIVKELRAILNAYNIYHKQEKIKIISLKSAFTSIYRKAFDLNKVRDFGDQHHAYDAAMVVIADKILSTYYPGYEAGGSRERYEQFINELKELTQNVNEESRKNSESKLKKFIIYAYEKAFHEPNNYSFSLISKLKSTKPLFSIKINKKYSGKFFDDTMYKPETNEKTVLSLLCVNNEKRSFTSVNCVAVDFYKYTNKKGQRKHLAVHIPKVIVDVNGNIDKNKYIKLVKEHYKVNEIIDENNEIKECYFRFRAFRNDLIYDTQTNTLQIFNLGSIAKQTLELKHIYNYSYDSLYKRANQIEQDIVKHFDLLRDNKKNKNYNDLDKNDLINYIYNEILDIDNKDRHQEYILEKMNKSVNSLRKLSEICSYIELVTNRKNNPSDVEGRYRPSANNTAFGSNQDVEYVKLKYNQLGIRVHNNKMGTIIIESPRGYSGKFKRIKHEKFSWNIGMNVLK